MLKCQLNERPNSSADTKPSAFSSQELFEITERTRRRVSYQFAFSALLLIEPVRTFDGRRAAGGARLGETRRDGAEGGTGTGGQPRIRTVEQSFPVLSFQAIIHRL